jgi:Domain of unknown function (DUF5916)
MIKLAACLALALAFVVPVAGALAADAFPSIAVPVLDATPSMNGTVDDSWAKATKLELTNDFTFKRAVEEPTTVYVAQDGAFLDVAFVVSQKESQTSAQETNSSSVLGDDFVGVYLSPQGSSGISYSFQANPHGARYQTSSENTAYSPQWTAVGKGTKTGYVVTMRIPLGIIRSGGSTAWKAQFSRATVATGSLAEWTYNAHSQGPTDPTYEGTLTGIGAAATAQSAARPKPRIGVYGLSESTSKENGGSTSRVGMDFALPITPTASFVGALHPDYSNVEIDQQTIAPSAFARQYAEVRPFFTQAASYFNGHVSCSNCPQTLYTPAIPTFAQGYAIEGTQGHLSFGAFDALADGRQDNAQSINYNYMDQNNNFGFSAQRVGVTYEGVSDVTSTESIGYLDPNTHFLEYLNLGQDRGTNVTDPAKGNYFESGVGYADATTTSVLNLQSIGAQFNPVDGFVSQTNIDGYEWFSTKTLNFSPTATVRDMTLQVFYARYNNDINQVSQTDANGTLMIDFKDLLTLHAYLGTTGTRIFDGEFLPFQSNGAMLGYRMSTATPTYVSYSGGSYFHGSLNSWVYLTTLPVMKKVHLSLETDENQYGTTWPGEVTTRQWLERAGLDWQFNRSASFDVGVRRIIGPNLPNAFQPLVYNSPYICFNNPYNPGCNVNASNVTLAYHFLTAKNEFYIVYGDANNISTEPALFLKWIRYIGAEKGT